MLTPRRRAGGRSSSVVFEHITTGVAAEFVRGARKGVAATITPQHLLLNRNAMFDGGLRPHHYCLPVLKRERDREALLEAATSDDARFFLGTDSAPHARHTKEAACGCAGIFSAHAAHRTLCGGVRGRGPARPPRSIRRRTAAPISMGCRATPAPSRCARGTWTVPDGYPFGAEATSSCHSAQDLTLAWRMTGRGMTDEIDTYEFVEPRIADRFRGFLPVVVDVETGGFNHQDRRAARSRGRA